MRQVIEELDISFLEKSHPDHSETAELTKALEKLQFGLLGCGISDILMAEVYIESLEILGLINVFKDVTDSLGFLGPE